MLIQSIVNNSLFATNSLNKANAKTTNLISQLSSGYRLTNAAYSPADSVIYNLLRSETLGTMRAIRNTQEANNVVSIAEGALASISQNLSKLKELTVHSATGTTSDAQISANQSEVNSLVNSINRILNTTNYGGKNLLNGSSTIDYTLRNNSNLLESNSVSISNITGYMPQNVSISFDSGVYQNAAQATITSKYTGATLSENSAFTIQAANTNMASANFSFTAGTSIQEVADTINAQSETTGVYADVLYNNKNEATNIQLFSGSTGHSEQVSVTQTVGSTFTTVGSTVTDYGEDRVSNYSSAINQAEKAVVDSVSTGETLAAAQQFTITGNQGSMQFSYAAGTKIEDIVSDINNASKSTGVEAYVGRNEFGQIDGLRLTSAEYGSKQTVKVQQNSGDLFANNGETITDTGQDARVRINGQQVIADGLNVNFTVQGVSGSFRLSDAAGQTRYDLAEPIDATASQSYISNIKGGTNLQLGSGSGVQNIDNLSLPDLNLGSIGRVTANGVAYSLQDLMSGQNASLAENPQLAMQIVDQAIKDVTSEQARLGAYQANNLQSNINNLRNQYTNLISNASYIGDTDYASAVTNYYKSQLQSQVGIQMLQANNMLASNVLSLLGGGAFTSRTSSIWG